VARLSKMMKNVLHIMQHLCDSSLSNLMMSSPVPNAFSRSAFFILAESRAFDFALSNRDCKYSSVISSLPESESESDILSECMSA
jgi:hypothetical protein